MASCFKMLSATGSLIAIPLDQLLSRLKQYGFECQEYRRFFLISDYDGDMCVPRGPSQLVEEFVVCGPFPHSIVAAIKKEFNVEIVRHDDHRYWGCTSKEELAARVRKAGERIQLLEAAQAASDETATSLDKRSISSRVSRTVDIVGDRIAAELDEYQEFLMNVPIAAIK